MNFHEFKRKMELLTIQEKEFIYSLTIKDAIDFLRTIDWGGLNEKSKCYFRKDRRIKLCSIK